VVRARRLGTRFEFVEEVQRVATFVPGDADLARDEGGEERIVVCEAMAAVEVCKAGCCGGQDVGEDWVVSMLASGNGMGAGEIECLPDIVGSQSHALVRN
jgi:hypothetical protein